MPHDAESPYSLHLDDLGTPVLAVALHQGAALSPDVASRIALDARERRREEDPFTGAWTTAYPNRIVVNRSRFDVDLNRPPARAVYLDPEDAWGLAIWRTLPSRSMLTRAWALHASFYATVRAVLDDLLARHPEVLVLDLHSYNHRRAGPDGPPAAPRLNPSLNVGTGSLPRARWAHVVDAFLGATRRSTLNGRPVDARENVRFRGGWFPTWVHRNYPRSVCALACEVKKTFMDEHTGVADEAQLTAWRAILRTGADASLRAMAPARARASA